MPRFSPPYPAGVDPYNFCHAVCCVAQVEEYQASGSAERLQEAGVKLEASRTRMAGHEQKVKVTNSVASQAASMHQQTCLVHIGFCGCSRA